MKRKLFLAVDLGTSFIKAGIYDLNSTCLAVWSEAVKDERPAPGFFCSMEKISTVRRYTA